MSLVVTGHVDHGKSTIVGRLLADTGSLPDGKLERIRALCEATARPFEYAFVLDALKDEQAQGITIDAARVFFASARRRYVILDAPGHVEFLKNMITGAAQAEAALIVIDAREGVQENSRRHGVLLSLLGVRQLAVVVNKMDLVGHDEAAFAGVVGEFGAFLERLTLEPACFIPVCGRDGANVARRSAAMPWYTGPTVLEALDSFTTRPPLEDRPFRMPVQGVYKFTEAGDDRRIVAGTVASGRLAVGDEVAFYPSGKRSRVRSIEAFNAAPPTAVAAGTATGFTLNEQLYVGRGEIVARVGEPAPGVATRLRVSLFWLGREPLSRRGEYLLKLGTARVPVRLEAVERVTDASTLATDVGAECVRRHAVAECVLRLGRALACDVAADVAETGRFVLVSDREIRGGGIVREVLPDSEPRRRIGARPAGDVWEPSATSPRRRAEGYGQLPALVLITGQDDDDRRSLAQELEARLLAAGRVVYCLGVRRPPLGGDGDDGPPTSEGAPAPVQRLAEITRVMLDAGTILIVTAAELAPADRQAITAGVEPEQVVTVWLGHDARAGRAHDLWVAAARPPGDAAEEIRALLRDRGVIFSVD
jgi:bifunctional enzyme CysN/CysC